MALENANYIPELDETNPDGNDPVSQGDDHLRTVKRSIANSFPGFVGTTAVPKSVTLTEDQVNDATQKSVANIWTANQEYQAALNFANNFAINMRQVDTTPRAFAKMDSNDNFIVGGNDNDMYVNADALHSLRIQNLEVGRVLPAASGSILVVDRNGQNRKAGFRNPGFVAFTTRAVTQNDEGQVLTPTGAGQALTLNTLEANTTFRIRTGANSITLTQGTAAISWLQGGTLLSGSRSIAPYSVVEVYYTGASAADVFGNGIS